MMPNNSEFFKFTDECEGIGVISLWGNSDTYCIGAIKQMELLKEIAPQWKMMICVSKTLGHPYNIEDINYKCKHMGNARIIEITNFNFEFLSSIERAGMFWRFLSFYLCDNKPVRSFDADSRITEREYQYMKFWVHSDKKYFTIRDHPHQKLPNGGTFGIKEDKSFFMSKIKNYFYTHNNTDFSLYGQDETFLNYFLSITNRDEWWISDILEPRSAKNNIIPRKNKNCFIGMGVDDQESSRHIAALEFLNREYPI